MPTLKFSPSSTDHTGEGRTKENTIVLSYRHTLTFYIKPIEKKHFTRILLSHFTETNIILSTTIRDISTIFDATVHIL